MSEGSKEKILNNPLNPNISIKEQIKIATETLNRNIGFVRECNIKAAFVLVLGLITFSNGVTIASQISLNSHILFPFVLFMAIISGIIGIGEIGTILFARLIVKVGCPIPTSHVFFMGITKFNIQKYEGYMLNEMTQEDILKDLVSEIYINSVIAKEKYQLYNQGIKFLFASAILFVIAIIIGTI